MRISKDICIIWSCDVLVCATWHQWNKDTFFGDHSLEHGVFLKQGETLVPFHAKLGILIADEVALKQSIEAKGAAGKVLCMRCQNTLSKSAWTPTLGRAGFVSSTCTDINKFRLHTNESVQKIVEHLRQSHDEMPQLQFQKLETSLGFNWKEDGILAHPVYGKEIPEIIMYDWFHIFLVHGVANRAWTPGWTSQESESLWGILGRVHLQLYSAQAVCRGSSKKDLWKENLQIWSHQLLSQWTGDCISIDQRVHSGVLVAWPWRSETSTCIRIETDGVLGSSHVVEPGWQCCCRWTPQQPSWLATSTLGCIRRWELGTKASLQPSSQWILEEAWVSLELLGARKKAPTG